MIGGTKLRVVVCAAIRRNEMIVCGARHFDRVMRSQLVALELTPVRWEQGFIDQFGIFMTREEAHEIAEANGQIKYRCGGDEHRLFSENLY